MKPPKWAIPKRRIFREENPTERNYGKLKDLNADERALWDRIYAEGMEVYNDKVYAEGAAWRAVRYDRGEDPADPGLVEGRMPNPEDTIILGKLVEFAWIAEENGQIRLFRLVFRPDEQPALLWSRKRMMLSAFRDVKVPSFREPLKPDQKALSIEYKRWAQRKPRGAAKVKVPAAVVYPVGAADTVVYRSSKWTNVPDDPPGSQEYIHQFSNDVALGASEDFQAMIWRGGKLDVLPAGIVN